LKNKQNLYPLVIFILALLIGLSFTILFKQSKLSPDAFEYDKLGWNLANARGYQIEEGIPDVTREPLYPFFLSGIYFLFGHNYLAVRVFQTIINALTCMLIYLIGKKIFGLKSALIASGVCVFYPAFINYTGFIFTETLFTFLLALAVFILLRAQEKKLKGLYILSGILLGLAILCKAVLIFFPFFISLVLFFTELKNKVKVHLLWIIIFSLLVIAPWTIRNYKIFHKVIPIRIGTGFNLWIGSYLPWEGKNMGGKGGYPEGRVKFIETEPLKSLVTGHSDLEVDTILRQEAIKNIKKNPAGFIKLSLKRAWRLWKQAIGQETLNNKSAFLGNIFAMIHYLFLFFAIYGIAFTLLNNFKAVIIPLSVILYFTLVYSVGYASPRYHLPALPYLILFASSGLLSVISSWA